MCADRLLHLNLLFTTLFGVQFGTQAAVVLCLLATIVTFTCYTFTLALVVIEALAVPGGVRFLLASSGGRDNGVVEIVE